MSIPDTSDTMKWDDYSRPSLAVDVAVLTVRTDTPRPALALLVIRRRTEEAQGKWDIPGAFVLNKERLAEAVRRALQQKAGVSDLEPVQLGIFDRPDRDPRGWVVSVAYSVAVPFQRLVPALASPDVELAPVKPSSPDRVSSASTSPPSAVVPPAGIALPDDQQQLPFDHQEMVDLAVADLRRRYEVQRDPVPQPSPDPDRLLEHEEFTVTELRRIYDAINGEPVQRDAFARRFVPPRGARTVEPWQLVPVEGSLSPTGGRPAQIYTLPRRDG